MTISTRTGVLLLLPLLLVALTGGIVRGQQRLAVRVVDAVSGAAIRGARAVAPGNQTVALSGADGLLEIAVTPPVLLQVRKPGYVAQALTKANGGLLRMQRAAVVVVQLFDERGAPRAFANVKVECPNFSGGMVSDDQGVARVSGVPPGKCTVRPGFDGLQVVMPGPPTDAEMRIALELMLKEGRARAKAPARDGIEVDVRAGQEVTIGVVDEQAERLSVVTLPGLGTTGNGSIEGRLLDRDGRPGAGVPVVLRSATIASTVETDGNGRFLFTRVPEGNFVLTPLVRSVVGSRPVSVTVRDGTPVTGVVLQETLVGVVTGRVFDEFGDPAEGVHLQLSPASKTDGPRFATSGDESDDRGVYRILAPPGSYHVGATFSGVRRPRELVFLPGVVVDLRAGATVNAINVTDLRTSAGVIRAVAMNSEGKPARGAHARLMGAGEVSFNTQIINTQAMLSDAGVVSFEGLPAGNYDLFITVPTPPFVVVTHKNGVATGATPPQTEFTHTEVTLGAGGVGLAVRTAPGSSLRGRVEFEGGRDGQRPDGVQFIVPTPRQPSPRPPTGIRSDGSFGIDDLSIRTRMAAQLTDDTWWLKSFMVNGVNAADEPVDFAGGRQSSDDVRAVFGRTARITGTVTDDTGKPRRGLAIAFPVERDRRYRRSRYIGIKGADLDGRFSLTVPPGTYWVVSVMPAPAALPGPPSEEEFLRLESRSTLTTVVEGQETQMPLRLVTSY